jgi:predicted Zn-dependent peptidase
MRLTSRVALAAVLALVAALPAAAAARAKKPAVPAAAAPASVRLEVQRHVLSNGLVVLLHEDHTVPALTFWQWYRVGSRNERPGITGISHYFEHMMFNGSKNVPPKEYDRILESNGGYSNAFTDRDMTAYFEDLASDRLEVALRLDSDRMTELTLDPKVLESEIGVVKEERRLRTDNDIFGMLDEQLWAVAFNASPYRSPVLGWMGDLERMERQDLVEYFRTYYAPNNCILVLAGDFESASALALIKRYFEGIPRQTPPLPPVDSEPEQRGERRVDVHYPAEQVTFMVGWKAPPASSRDYAVLDVIASILSDGESSRLHQALVYEKQLALFAGTSYQAMLGPTLFQAYVQLRPGKAGDEGLAAMDEVIARLVEQGPTEKELQKAKNLLEAQFVKSLKTNNGIGQQLGFHEHVFGDYNEMFRAVDRYRAVTAEDCRRVARTVFDANRRTVSMLVPEPETAAGVTP